MNSRISAVVLTRNEENNIADCLESLNWCNEVIVIDDFSKDRTLEIAKKIGAKVYSRKLDNDFSNQRNFGLEKVNSEWVLFVDADERVSEELREEVKKFIEEKGSDYNGAYIKRIDIIWRKTLKHGETGNVKLLRIAKRSAGKWNGKVHEQWAIKGATIELSNPIIHYPHQTVSEFLSEINFYSTLRAEELYEQGKKVSFLSLILYPKGKFLVHYIFKMGFRDGIPGLIIALMMSFHSFLVRGKLWQLQEKKLS